MSGTRRFFIWHLWHLETVHLLFRSDTSMTCTLDFRELPVRPSRRFDCVCDVEECSEDQCLGPGPDTINQHYQPALSTSCDPSSQLSF